jgi:rhamnosyltransferase subunit B
VVHQGGIGTTGEALRAGRPMLVVPHSHDQPDHGRRLRRLGVARTIPAGRYDARRAIEALGDLLRDPGYDDRAGRLAESVRTDSGVRTACDAIDGLLARDVSDRKAS